MRREHRHRLARRRHRLLLGVRDLGGADTSPRPAMRSSTRSRARLRRCRKAIGPAKLRRLRQRDQQRRLAERQPPRLLAEIGERGRAHAFEIAAIGREREIERRGSRPCSAPVRARARAPSAAAWRRAMRSLPRLEQARDLHGERRAAGDDAAMRDELARRAHRRERIDAAMVAEALVLIGEQHLEVARIDVCSRVAGSRQRPSLVR